MPRLDHDTEGRGHRFLISVFAYAEALSPIMYKNHGRCCRLARQRKSRRAYPISDIDTQTNDGRFRSYACDMTLKKFCPGRGLIGLRLHNTVCARRWWR